MPNADAIKLLFVELVEGNGRAVETFLRGLNRNDLFVRTVSSADEIKMVGHETWDAVLLDVGDSYGKKEDFTAKVKLYCGKVPIIDLGHGSGESITSGNTAALEAYFRPITVNTLVVLRAINHVLEHRRLYDEVEKLQARLAEVDRTDSMTGVWTHDYVIERIHELFLDFQRYKYPMTLMLFEVADLNVINENYGFEISDKVIATFGRLLAQTKRSNDYAGRLGLAQFCVAFPSTPLQSAMIGVERIRAAIQRTVFTGKSSDNFTVGAYFGVVQIGEKHAEFDDLMNEAEKTLERAKSGGVNHIEVG